jgi:hypothetical protein
MRYEIREHRGYFAIALDGREVIKFSTRADAEKLLADYLDEDRPNIIKLRR